MIGSWIALGLAGSSSTAGTAETGTTDVADMLADAPDTETLIYRPSSGGTRYVSALVDRERLAPLEDVDGGKCPRFVVLVENDSTAGISASEIDTGGDRIDIAIRRGGTATTRTIVQVFEEDDFGGGALLFEAR